MNSLIVIGASTRGGGIGNFLYGLPEYFSISILVVQHILPGFTGIFIKRLDKKRNLAVREGKQGGHIKILACIHSPTGKHLVFRHFTIYLDDESIVNFIKSSADVTMKYAARLFRKNAVGIILTGSWADGAVVDNTPGNAIQSGNMDYVLAVEDIADEIVELVKEL